MHATSSTGIHYWEKYFILKLLPTPGEFVDVDITQDTREYAVMSDLIYYKHVIFKDTDNTIEAIASTPSGVNFFNYLVRIGFGTIQSEEEGRLIVKGLEDEYYNRLREDEDLHDDTDDHNLSESFDPFVGTAARLIIILGYSINKLDAALQIDNERFEAIIQTLVDCGFIDDNGNPLLTEEGLEFVLDKYNLG